MSKNILSAIQTSGNLHLGNYIGAIKQWNKLIEVNTKDNMFFMLADLHSLTTEKNPLKIKENRKNGLINYLATIDKKSNVRLFFQSEVPELTYLTWLFANFSPIGELFRMTQFKDKKDKEENTNSGLLFYPILMTSDILAFDTDIVPVGEDQIQHIEFARNIANRVNSFFNKEIFRIPNYQVLKNGKRIMGLQNPLKKMSKSTSSEKDIIYLEDSNELISKKIKNAVTDSISEINYDKENRPGISNLIEIYSSISKIEIELIVEKYRSSGNKIFKENLTNLIINETEPIRIKIQEIRKNFEDYYKEFQKDLPFVKNIAKEKLDLFSKELNLK